MKDEHSSIFNALFEKLSPEYKKLSPAERIQWSKKIVDEFNKHLQNMQRHVAETEYGDHVAGMHGLDYTGGGEKTGHFPRHRGMK